MAREMVLVLDFGDPSAILAARMIRSAKVYSEILPSSTPLSAVKEKSPAGIVCVGGAQDTDRPGAPVFNPALLTLGVPVLALGYAARALCVAEGGRLDGRMISGQLKDIPLPKASLVEGIEPGARYIARADRMIPPKGYEVLSAVDGVIMAMRREGASVFALQLIPEQNDVDFVRLLSNFAVGVCGCKPTWSVRVFVEEAVADLRAKIGSGTALLSMSGGVDSSVCAALVHKAVGARLHCIFVDTGLMRKDEPEKVRRIFGEKLGIHLEVADASQRFFAGLAGVTDPTQKRRVIAKELEDAVAGQSRRIGAMDFLIKGTIYRDLMEKAGGDYAFTAFTAQENAAFRGVIEPLRALFKDEVRAAGELLGLPQEIIHRQSFPGTGLAVRCLGEVTPEKLAVLREADAIMREEIDRAGLARSIWQYFAVLTGAHTTGTGPAGRTYGHVVALRAVHSTDASNATIVRLPYDLLARIAQRITQEIPEVSRVVYDITGKPPATVEWE